MSAGYFVGIGSNIDARLHIPQALHALLSVSPELTLSRVLETQAKGIESKFSFLNAVVYLRTDLDGRELKRYLNQVEEMLGRDRSDPERGRKDRSIDLDVLLSLRREAREIKGEQVADETYYRPQMLELIHLLGFPCRVPADPVGEAVELDFEGGHVGAIPVQICCRGAVFPAACLCRH
jgi:2-amino-4-hydroxy-6-hydroxymethyldihydropteridine diphosphokinase